MIDLLLFKLPKFVPDGSLLGLDMRIATQKGHCPYCMCKLYAMRNRPMMYCKKKNCPKRISGKGFVISKSKIK